MKKYFIFFFLPAILFTFNISKAQFINGSDARAVVKNAESIVLINDDYLPSYIKLRAGEEIELATISLWLIENFKLSSGFGLKFIKSEKDDIGYTHYRYQQTINGYPVDEGDYIAHVKNGMVVSLNGKIKKYIEPRTNITLNESEALDKALKYVNAAVYKWQVPEEEKFIKYFRGDSVATFYPKGELTIVQNKGNSTLEEYSLAYRFDIYADKPMSRQYVFVDAISGEVIKTLNKIYTSNVAATAETKYSGTRTIITDYTGSTYRLRETGRGLGIETYDMNVGTNYGSAVDFTNSTTTWTGTNSYKDEVARDAHWGTEMTYDYYYNKFSRNSIDNAGFKLLSYVHANLVGMGYSDNVNAFWDGTRMTYGDGNATYSPLTTLDICAHEITHGVTTFTANLNYSYESGALNEGFSDIFGTCIEFYAKPPLASGNWTIGEQIGAAFRSMSNPNTYQQPDTYNGTYWYTGSSDNGGVHTNSGVFNFWFYLLCQGGSGTNDNGNAYNVTGITMTKAEQIAYRTLAYYLTSSSVYADARTYSILACQDLYGGCSAEAQATTNAWYACGVGAAFSASAANADFTACPKVYCSAPATVQFTNVSSNGNTFKWYFGDGSTSTLSNPSHVYSSQGNFDVKLVAYGGSCGNDSLTQVSFISVNSNNPCPSNMPATGTGTAKTTCAGTLYDSGGCSEYANNTDGNITISPTGATSVTLHFISFNFEANYDYLYVYNGPTTASTLIGQYSGTSLPNGGTITSSGGSITLRQTSDAGVVASGFELNWTCISPIFPPSVNFTADKATSCTGTIQFTDQSSNTPTAWLWNFGDGTTSSLQNPSHTYSTNGTYNVKLKATNAYGSDSLTKLSYMTITLPAAPATTGSSRCGTGAVTLTASGAGTLKWYNAATDGSLVTTGTSYTTPYLATTTTYYVQDSVPGATYNCAKPNNTGGGGYTSTGNHYLIFDCYTAIKLVSVKIYGNTTAPGNKTIALLNSAGTVLQSANVNVLSGLNTYTLNFNLPVGTNLRLQCEGTNVFRNNTGVAYPYSTTGFISVTGTDAGAAYYYYFYDWIIQEDACKSARAPVTATIIPIVSASVSIGASPTGTICSGSNVTFIATPVNGGTTPSYQWKMNGTNISGATNAICTSSTLANTDAISCVLTSNAQCITGSPTTSNTITMSVITPAAVSVSITAIPTGAICAGNSVSFTAVPVNGGTTPSYQWKKNGTDISNATTSTYSSGVLENNNVITCVLTSNTFCITGSPATSNPITMTVNESVAASVNIASDPSGSTCPGTSVTFIATPANGGTLPSYQWTKNGGIISGATNATYTSNTLFNGDAISCAMTSNAACATGSPSTSNAINLAVDPSPPAIPGQITGTVTQNPAVTGQIYSIDDVADATNYIWTVPTGWSITNGQGTTIITVTSGYVGQDGNIGVIASNNCGNSNEQILAVVVVLPDKILNLSSVLLEGLYNSAGNMKQSMDNQGPHWPTGIADHITIELHNAVNYNTIDYSVADVPLTTAGAASIIIPSIYNGSYYITIRHRNSVETTTFTPVPFSGNIINQSFASPADVYGGNLGVSGDNHYFIYVGDVNQDRIIDSSDYLEIDNDSYNYLTGYHVSDINGDGIIDTDDYVPVDNNNYNYVGAALP